MYIDILEFYVKLLYIILLYKIKLLIFIGLMLIKN